MGGKKCPQQYVGETEKSLKHRFSEHKGYVTNKMYTKATGLHLNEEGHTVSVMEVTVLEKVLTSIISSENKEKKSSSANSILD